MSLHARQAYTVEIRELEHDLLEMGSRAESQVALSVEALTALDTQLAMSVILGDDEIDQRNLEIEGRCLRLLALQQPMAGDLRVIGTALKMITDIERVGDLAVDLAKITLKVDRELGRPNCIDIPRMAGAARAMFRESLEAYVRRDLERVQTVVNLEHQVDQLYRDLRGQLFDDMHLEPAQVVADSWLLLAIHHVERIADHAVNIAERVNFMVTGVYKPLGRPDLPENSADPSSEAESPS